MPKLAVRQPKPDWIKVRPPAGDQYVAIKELLRARNLHTVCEEAHCPNLSECWGGGTATFMLLGDTCTRGCRFCNVKSGNPMGLVDAMEPAKIADAVREMKLTYIVLTTVDRDDLPDGGAAHFAQTVSAIRALSPGTLVEVLVGDFGGNLPAIEHMLSSRPDVYAHNMETVERLTPSVRDRRATYRQSLMVLERAKAYDSKLYTKSSIMLGLGETRDEVVQAMRDLRAVGCDILTFGQYLQPSPKHLPVQAFVRPEEFEEYRRLGEAEGFEFVASGPLVRSSYRAGEYFLENKLRQRGQGTSNA